MSEDDDLLDLFELEEEGDDAFEPRFTIDELRQTNPELWDNIPDASYDY